MEASGVPQRRIARLITAENLAVTVVGIVPGLALGWLAADAFLGTYSTDQISFDLVLRWYTPLLAAAIIVVVALLSQRPGLRAVARLDVAQVVRERAL
jgi:putative ABC transport system permease protein